jgi:YidC/Oxa1 family membrane protein insertase
VSITEILIKLLEFFEDFFGSYGLAIFMVILTIKLVLFPLTLYSQRSILKTQKITPLLNEIREKYKNDMEKQSKKITELYAEHNLSMFSPLMSLVPIFLTWPVIIAIFNLLQSYFKDLGASFLWISDISQKGYLEIAILVALMQIISMYINSKTMNTNQPKSMLYITMGLSLFIGYLAYTYPAALGIYWFSFSLIGIVEQLLIKKVFLRKHVDEINAMKK